MESLHCEIYERAGEVRRPMNPFLGVVYVWTSMKAHELLNSTEVWCQDSPAEDGRGNRLQALDPRAEKWCALAAIQKVYPPFQWENAMDRLLRVLSVSEKGLTQMTISDKACSLMEWNGDRRSSFLEVSEILLSADI